MLSVPNRHNYRKILIIIGCVIVLLGALGFGWWKFSQNTVNKNDKMVQAEVKKPAPTSISSNVLFFKFTIGDVVKVLTFP